MSWGLRVATRAEAGAGHMMRCLGLAQALGGSSSFFIESESTWITAIEESGHSVVIERNPQSVERTLAALANGSIEAAVFDGYDFEPEAVAKARGVGVSVAIRDSPGGAPVNVVIAPGLSATSADYVQEAEAVLAGPAYALLRPEFATAHREILAAVPRAEPLHRILISFGARDSSNATGAALEALACFGHNLEIRVILGAQAPHADSVRCAAGTMKNVDIICDARDMIMHYRWADLAIGAGGVSLLERLCCGLPSLLITLAANQESNARGAEALGVALWAGSIEDLKRHELARRLQAALDDPAACTAMRARALALIDGLGAQRVAGRLASVSKMSP
jgi:UDP-2,4-diacetamido-2,4,6-trideoxy-beta-L-altropyranose hydrolase